MMIWDLRRAETECGVHWSGRPEPSVDEEESTPSQYQMARTQLGRYPDRRILLLINNHFSI
jgi:hypothetical protein